MKRRLHDARAKLKTEMVDLVKDTLTSERPSDDFGDQVYEMIRQYATERDGQWYHAYWRIVDLGLDGVEGLEKAITSPHGDTRWLVPKLVDGFHQKATREDQREGLVEILKLCLNDSSKKVRRAAVGALLRLDVSKERKYGEFVPLVIERLDDRSQMVQRKAASKLLGFSKHVPLERAAMALARLDAVSNKNRFPGDMTQRYMSRLVRAIINSRT